MARITLTGALYAALAACAVAQKAPNARPPPAQRTFNSTAVNNLIDSWLPKFIDPNLGTIFANCLPNTLDTTIQAAGYNDSFVITGDIPAMWLRDSTNEVGAICNTPKHLGT